MQLVGHARGHLADRGHLVSPDQVPLPLGLLMPLAVDGHGQHIGHGLKEINIILCEPAFLGSECTQSAIGVRLPLNDRADATDNPMSTEEDRITETRLRAEIIHDDRLAEQEGVACGAYPSAPQGGLAHQPVRPTRAGPQQQVGAIGE